MAKKAGKGYRLLDSDEVIEEGDEYWSEFSNSKRELSRLRKENLELKEKLNSIIDRIGKILTE